MRLAVAVLSCGAAAAQGVWGTTGTWSQQLGSLGTTGPSAVEWHAAVATGGCLYVCGGDDTQGGSNATYQYDPATRIWARLPQLPAAGVVAADVTTAGGQLLLVGGSGGVPPMFTSTLYTLSTTSPQAGWVVQQIAQNGLLPRRGHRIQAFGGILYLFGGWDTTQYFNDVWALDTNDLLSGPANASWWPVVQGDSPGTPDLSSPPQRNGCSFDVYSHHMVLFGGFWHK